LPPGFLEEIQTEAGVRRNNSVYSPLVVLWLLVLQRLQGGASLGSAVLELLRGLPASFWPRPCKRIRQWRERHTGLSSHTGAYNQARQALPVSMVQRSSDRIFEQLSARLDPTIPAGTPRAFLLDGTSMRLAHTPALCQLYPPGSNQYGEAHWPLLRVLVAHDLHTGLAMRPEWGPMHGPGAVSEQRLLERALQRLPAGAVLIGDANFGVFSVAYTASQSVHPCLLRLTAERARRIAGGSLRDGIDRTLRWEPSRADRMSHPELPADACVSGRLIVRQVQPSNGATPFLLALFTTLEGDWREALELYGRRWAIETDLRTLKTTLRLEQLNCTTPEMVAKEIDMGIAAYNLVRAMIGLAAEGSGLAPRGYSFTKVRRIVEIFGPLLAKAPDPAEAKQIFEQMMYYVHQSKLPNRKRKRPAYPREVWPRGDSFPRRKR
jgi:hypothetical protein